MNILEEANMITSQDRQKDYGNPKENFEHIAEVASAITGKNFSAKEIVFVLIATKLCREKHKPKRDNRVDLAGYSWVLDVVEANKQ